MVTIAQVISNKVKKLIIISYLISGVFAVISYSGYFCNGVINRGYGYFPEIGLVYKIFLVNLTFWIFLGLINVIKGYNISKSAQEKNRLKYFFSAASINVAS